MRSALDTTTSKVPIISFCIFQHLLPVVLPLETAILSPFELPSVSANDVSGDVCAIHQSCSHVLQMLDGILWHIVHLQSKPGEEPMADHMINTG